MLRGHCVDGGHGRGYVRVAAVIRTSPYRSYRPMSARPSIVPARRVAGALLTILALVLSPLLTPATAVGQRADSGLPPLRVVEPRWIDKSANACTDFFQYANGAWLAHDTIPAAYASSGVTRDMSDRNELVVRAVLEDAAAHRAAFPPDSTPRKLGTFYATCMDSTAAEAAGVNPIRPWLAGVDSITSRARLLPQIAALQ